MDLQSESLNCQNMLANEGVGIVIWDKDKKLAQLNQKARDITDSKLNVGHSWYDIFVSQLREKEFAGESMERGLTPELKKIWEVGKKIEPEKIEEIKAEVDSICGGEPAKPKLNKENVVAVVKWVDGTLLDSVFQIEN